MLVGDEKEIHTWRQIELGQSRSPLYSNQRKDLILLFDGELFYQEELQSKLQKRCNGPEELILEAYEEWGEKFLTYLEGDFALAILDKSRSKLLLARDRVGKKPLYWGEVGGHFLFGSELKGLLATGIVPKTPSAEALATYLALGYCPQDVTLIENVNKLLPAHFLVLDQLKKIRIESYWSFSSFFHHQTGPHHGEIAERLEYILKEAVKQRSRNKKGVGCFLSGGLGSASVGWFLKSQEPNTPFHSYSTFFEGEDEEDFLAAEQFSQSLSSPIQVQTIMAHEFLSHLSEILWEIEEPIADPHLMAIWHLVKMPSRETAMFSGMGSDELLAGHTRYTLEQRELGPVEKVFSNLSLKWKRGLVPLYHFFGSNKAYDLLRQVRVNPYLTQYVHQNLFFQKRILAKASPQLAPLFDPIVFLQKFHHLHKIENTVSAFMYLDFKTSLPDFYSEPYERLTFNAGLYWETPFLDKRVIEFAAQILESEDLTKFETFYYLKKIIRPHFPQEMVGRPKRVRRAFLSQWANDPFLLPHFIQLQKGPLVEMGYVDPLWLDHVLSSPKLRKRHFRQLFSLLVLQEWFGLFILESGSPNSSIGTGQS